MFVLSPPPLFLEICWTNRVVCPTKFTRNWLTACPPRALHLHHDAVRSSFMIFPPFYRWENWGSENTCLAKTSIIKEAAEPRPPVFHPEKKKKNGTSSSEPLVQYLACTYWTVKRAASGQPVNTDSTDLANHEANLSLPWVLLFIFIFCHTTRPVGS